MQRYSGSRPYRAVPGLGRGTRVVTTMTTGQTMRPVRAIGKPRLLEVKRHKGAIGAPNAGVEALPGNSAIEARSYSSIEPWRQLDDAVNARARSP
jgi:hypothetical protein